MASKIVFRVFLSGVSFTSASCVLWCVKALTFDPIDFTLQSGCIGSSESGDIADLSGSAESNLKLPRRSI